MRKEILFLFLCILSWTVTSAQVEVAKVVKLDEFVVSAAIEDFDVEDFVTQVMDDTTFYKAFLNLKYYPHDIHASMMVYDKDEQQRATLERRARQFLNTNRETWVDIKYERTNGRIRKKNGEWRYLTAEMFDEVFFPTTPQKTSNRIVATEQELVSGSKLEKHKSQLKKMLFNPGAEISNVPFIGDKMAIFDPAMVPHYDYAIYLATLPDSVPCIVFSSYAKPGHEGSTVIRNMTTYFHRDTKQVMAREYRLAYSNILFDFDITIEVHNAIRDGLILPTTIAYDGFWKVPFKKAEIIAFDLAFLRYITHADTYIGN